MPGLSKAMLWQRLDAPGAEQVVFSDRRGLHAHGTMVLALPVPYTCRYELYTDESWVTARFEATVQGAGFIRSVRLEHAAGRWRVTGSEQGDLDSALRAAGLPRASLPGTEDPGGLPPAFDVDLAGSSLTNTLPVRRLGLLEAEPGTTHTVHVAWVLLPSLEVVPSVQTYRVMGDGVVSFSSGTFHAELTLDAEGYVRRYPGLAERA